MGNLVGIARIVLTVLSSLNVWRMSAGHGHNVGISGASRSFLQVVYEPRLTEDRFTKRQYAPIDIVQTEMKGYGLRATGDIAGYDSEP